MYFCVYTRFGVWYLKTEKKYSIGNNFSLNSFEFFKHIYILEEWKCFDPKSACTHTFEFIFFHLFPGDDLDPVSLKWSDDLHPTTVCALLDGLPLPPSSLISVSITWHGNCLHGVSTTPLVCGFHGNLPFILSPLGGVCKRYNCVCSVY